jgi:Methylamine utilisation protein MauE
MAAAALASKATIAVLLVAAGAAKLADLAGFGGAVRLFLPARTSRTVVRAVAAAIAVTEIGIGAASLSSPLARWLNLAALALCCGFVAVSAIGYLRHPGRACRCFGALTKHSFSLAAIGRAALIATTAGFAAVPAGAPLLRLGAAGRLGLLAGAAFVAWSAWSAAAAIGAGRHAQPGWAGGWMGDRTGGWAP